MSGEGSRLPPADLAASTERENTASTYPHPPNTGLLDPKTQEVIDPGIHPSQASQTQSPSATTTAQPSLDASSNTLENPSSAVAVPIRTSSNSQNQASSSSQPEPNNAKGLVQKFSRGSLKPKSRTGSSASSKKAAENKVAVANTGKPKKKSKLFSCFGCCGGSDHANDIELSDQTVPPKKTPIPQASPDRQAAPVLKANQNTAAGGFSGSEQAGSESIGGTPYSQLPPANKPQIQVSESEGTAGSQPKPDYSGQRDPEGKTVPAYDPRMLPAMPSNPDSDMSANRDSSTLVESKGNQETPEPSIKVPEAPATEEENMAINDRSPQQEEKDVEMQEAPPLSAEETPKPEKRQSMVQNLPLPPPPPRPISARELAPDQRSSAGASQDNQQWLLKPLEPRDQGKKCLVLDLDETLVHSSFKILHQADFTIPVEIEGQYHNVYVIKRPGVDEFMRRVGELYEVVVFTASVSKYGQPLLDQLDIHNVVRHRLYRESCYNHQGNYVKDLSQIGRDLRETIIIDNSPTSYIFHPQHAVPISSWFSDAHDNELLDLIPVLEDLAGEGVRDVSLVLDVAL